jgi:hypothetical protein
VTLEEKSDYDICYDLGKYTEAEFVLWEETRDEKLRREEAGKWTLSKIDCLEIRYAAWTEGAK